MKNKIVTLIFTLLLINNSIAQKTLTIDEIFEFAFKNSNRIKIINNNFQKSKIEFNLTKIAILPKVSASVSLPYQRSISEVIQANGSQKFIERNFLNSALNLNISQLLPFTGGTLNVTSSINNSRDFNNNISSFSSNWVNVSYQQSINGYNRYKWDKKLNNLGFKKDSIDFLKEKYKLKYDISKIYLELNISSLKIDLLKQNILKTEKILVEIEEKFKFGRVLKIELDQLKITLNQLNNQLKYSQSSYNIGINDLFSVINYKTIETVILKNVEFAAFKIDENVLKKAIKSNDFEVTKSIKQIQSDAKIEKVKKEGAISVNLQLGLGLNSTAIDFSRLYELPSQSQFVTIGTKIPILDWGLSRKNLIIANLEKDNVALELKEQEIKLEDKVDEIINYQSSLLTNNNYFQEQVNLSQTVSGVFYELLKMGRKTISEYNNQIAETFKTQIEYQTNSNNMYLLKLNIDSILHRFN
jgi:outer membrane protein